MIFSAEWTYLLTTRKVGGEDSVFSFVRLKYGENATDTVTGVIIYPDDFSFSEVGVASIAFGARPLTQINSADWEALENAGCIFLPSAGTRSFTLDNQLSINETDFGQTAICLSSSAYNASFAFTVYFVSSAKVVNPMNSFSRFNGSQVRLVQDLE